MFEEFDADGSGDIDKDEMRLAFDKLGIHLTESGLDILYAHFDRDGDGVEYGEFCRTFYDRRNKNEERAEKERLKKRSRLWKPK